MRWVEEGERVWEGKRGRLHGQVMEQSSDPPVGRPDACNGAEDDTVARLVSCVSILQYPRGAEIWEWFVRTVLLDTHMGPKEHQSPINQKPSINPFPN